MRGQSLKKHFHSKLGFGLSFSDYSDLNDFDIGRSLKKELNRSKVKALNINPELNRPGALKGMEQEEKMAALKDDKMKIIQLNSDWIREMAHSENPLQERMGLFWHDHFACNPKFSYMAESYVNLIRTEALGNFGEMLRQMAKEPAMLLYLNNQQNRKNKPNENFARELMELFTLGIGNYTEKDIKESARAFTGWSVGSDGKFRVNERQHDFGSKSFFGKTKNWTGEEVIEHLLDQKETAQYVSGKIGRYLLGMSPSKKLQEELTDVFYNSGYEIKSVVETVVLSKQFSEGSNFANDVYSPVELLVRIERDFNLQYENDKLRLGLQKRLGQVLFQPPNVAGWPVGKGWIDASNMPTRLSIARAALLKKEMPTGKNKSFAQGEDLTDKLKVGGKFLKVETDISQQEKAWSSLSFNDQIDEAANWMIPDQFIDDNELIKAIKTTELEGVDYALALVASIPEYQLK